MNGRRQDPGQVDVVPHNLGQDQGENEKAFGASESALEAYNKADADLNLS